MLLPACESISDACKRSRWCNPGPGTAVMLSGQHATAQVPPFLSHGREGKGTKSRQSSPPRSVPEEASSPRGTSSSWPGSILNEAFHFLAAPAPQCASNWVHENSRSPSGLRRQSAHSQITRWGPSSKVPRMLLQLTTNCRAQGVSGCGDSPAGHQNCRAKKCQVRACRRSASTVTGRSGAERSLTQLSPACRIPGQTKLLMKCRLYMALQGTLVMLHLG